MASAIAETLRQAALTPPDTGKLIANLDSRHALDRLLRAGVVIRTVDRVEEREFMFHKDAVEEAQRRLAPVLHAERGLLLGEIGAVLGISRKYSVPLVEYLDHTKFTQRVGDRHVAGSAARRFRVSNGVDIDDVAQREPSTKE